MSACSPQMLICLHFRFQGVSQLKASQEPVRMSMMDPNLLDAATFGGPTSPLDIKPEAGTLLTTVTSALTSPGSASTSSRASQREVCQCFPLQQRGAGRSHIRGGRGQTGLSSFLHFLQRFFQLITVIAKNGDWWTGVIGDRTGVFPFNYVEPAPQVSPSPCPGLPTKCCALRVISFNAHALCVCKLDWDGDNHGCIFFVVNMSQPRYWVTFRDLCFISSNSLGW